MESDKPPLKAPAPVPETSSTEGGAIAAPVLRAWAEWLQQLSRTIKTCRLYDAANPTVVAFRSELASALEALLQAHGPFEIGFTPDVIVAGETPLYTARSREDNLALPFFRDGIRALTFQPGIQPREVDALVDALLHVGRLGHEDEDLVTVLWESELDHLSVRYVSTEGDIESGGEGALDAHAEVVPGSIAPWPRPSAAAASGPATVADSEAPAMDDTGRSDDRWTANETRETETHVVKLEIDADAEATRFRSEHDGERGLPLSRTALDLMQACFDHAVRDTDRVELRKFLPRLLHESVGHGDWNEARECFYLLRDPTGRDDTVAAFLRDIARPDSVTSRNAWKCLDHQTPEQQEPFFELASEMGAESADWLMQGIAESQRQGLRRRLATVVASLLSENPERLAPWLADPRWYVVRNVVSILGQVEGAVPIGLLRVAARHAEYRVKREVVAALSRAPRAESRPVLLEMLNSAETRLFGTILHHLSQVRDAELAAMLFKQIEDPSFASRPEPERRAIYQALGAVGDDDVVPLLETQVLQGNWLRRGDESVRMAAVMCLARIGTAKAREVLENGARSKRAEVVRACETGLASLRSRPGETAS